MPICKAYPHLVKSITVAKDRYSPIVLSGVVSKDNEARYTTNLPMVVELFLPYFTTEGSPTSIKFAVGEDVSVNCLIGMSFIQGAKLVLDLNDNVAESKVLDVEPFDLTFMAPSKTIPNIIPIDTEPADKTLAAIMEAEQHLHNFSPNIPVVEGPTTQPVTPAVYVNGGNNPVPNTTTASSGKNHVQFVDKINV